MDWKQTLSAGRDQGILASVGEHPEGQLMMSPIFLSSHKYNLPPSKPSSWFPSSI
jgi:hypothetical protein